MFDTTNEDSSFDIDNQVGSSTPMNSSFLSPIKKFDNLNLNNLSDIDENDESKLPQDYLNDISGDEISGDDDDDDDDDDIGDHKIDHSTDEEDLNDIISDKPIYINKRKRPNVSDIDMITPTSNPSRSSSNGYVEDSSKMSICSNNNLTSTSLSNFKLSFSNSDSTPCPAPAKKKLKFRSIDTQTPMSKKKLLNLQHSIKTNINELPDYEYNYHEPYERSSSPIEVIASNLNEQSTPISQSTPSNSRIPSPIIESTVEINGYKLLNKEVEINEFNLDDSHVGDQRVEADDDDSIFNRRKNDPYLRTPEPLSRSMDIRSNYMINKFKLPLLEDIPETKSELLLILTNENILEFYNFIKLPNESMIDLLKSERIKWHPDRWINDNLDMEIVNCVSQSINSLIETL